MPVIFAVLVIGSEIVFHFEAIAENAISRMGAHGSSITHHSRSVLQRSPAGSRHATLRIPGVLADDVDYPVDRVCPPYRSSRSAYDLDTLDEVERNILRVQNTPEKMGVYTVRPSIKTRSCLEYWPLKPRAVMAQVLGLIWPRPIQAPCATSRECWSHRSAGCLLS